MAINPPVIEIPLANQMAIRGSQFIYQLPKDLASYDAGTLLGISFAQPGGVPLPSWLFYDSVERVLYGTPPLGAPDLTLEVTFTSYAQDGSGESASTSDNVTFDFVDQLVVAGNKSPTILTSLGDQAAFGGDKFQYTLPNLEFFDADGDAVTITNVSSASGAILPSWLTFDKATNTFSGTPPVNSLGNSVIWSIKVTASDGEATVFDTFDIVVHPPQADGMFNHAPKVANSIKDATIRPGETWQLAIPSNTFSDLESSTLTYEVTDGNGNSRPANMKFNPIGNTITFTPYDGVGLDSDQTGTFSILVKATDGGGLYAYENFNVNVVPFVAPVVKNPLADQTVTAGINGNTFGYDLANDFYDFENDTLSFSATLSDGSALPVWIIFTAATQTFTVNAPLAFAGNTYNIKVMISDSHGGVTYDEFGLTLEGNVAPTVTNPIEDISVETNSAINFELAPDTFFDANGDPLTLTATLADGSVLPSWLTFDAATGTFSGNAPDDQAGIYSVKVTATDDSGAQAWDIFDINAIFINEAPVLTATVANQSATEDVQFSLNFDSGLFIDNDVGQVLTWTVNAVDANGNDVALPSWLSFDSVTKTLSGTPLNGDVGVLSVKVIATDPVGASAFDVFDINIVNVNDAPSMIPIDDQSVVEDTPFVFQIPPGTITDVDVGDTLSVTAVARDLNGNDIPLPAWLSFDAATQMFTGTPGNGDVGNIAVKVIASDAAGLSSSVVFLIHVDSLNHAPVQMLTVGFRTATEDTPFALAINSGMFVDSDAGDFLTWSANAVDNNGNDMPLPAWLSFDPVMLTFSGTPLNGDVGLLDVKIMATDSAGAVAFEIFEIEIANTNDAPVVANAIADQAATAGSAMLFTVPGDTFADVDFGDTLDLSVTLADGSALPAWLAFDAVTGAFTGTPGAGDVGTISVKVTATDSAGATTFDIFDIVVAPAGGGGGNNAPVVANAIADQNATEDAVFAFALPAATFNDADNDPLTLTATLADGSALPGWLTFNAATGTFTGTPLNGDVGTISVMVTANDGQGGVVSDVFDITIANTNDAPVVANAIVDQNATAGSAMLFTVPANTFADVDVGDSLALTAQAVDAQGNPIAAPAWLAFDAATGTFSGTPGAGDVGTVAIKVTAMDDAGATTFDIFDIVVAPAGGGGGNTAPVVANAIGDQAALEDKIFAFTLPAGTFTDADNDPLALTATLADGSALPGWLAFNIATGTFTGTPTNGDVGTISVMVTADDGQGGVVSDVFDITIANTNDAPVVANAIVDQNATAGSAMLFTVPANTFDDVDVGDSLALTAQAVDAQGNPIAAPAWLTFDQATGTFSGTPGAGDVGTVHVKVTAMDDAGATIFDIFDIVVAPAGGGGNTAPVVANAILDQAATEDAAFAFALPPGTFTDADGDPLALTATLADGSALPGWLTFNDGTGTFTGTPLNGDVGTISVMVTASDGQGGTVSDVFDITIANVNDAPVVANALVDQAATAGSAMLFTVPANTFADVDVGDSLALTAQAVDAQGNPIAAPAWLTFDQATGTFSGTPGAGDVGTVHVKVTAMDDAGATIFDIFDIVVAPAGGGGNTAPVVANAILDQAATEDAAFAFALPPGTFTDADGDPLALTATLADGSALPGWLTFNAGTGTFTGTPLNGDIGTISVMVTADDGQGGVVSDVFDITIANVNDAPVVANALVDQAATAGSAMLFTVPANTFADVDVGDTLDLSVTLADGSALPGWLNFNAATGAFTGTPGAGDVGTISVKVTATDDAGATTFDIFDIVVAPAGGGNNAPVVANVIVNQNATEDAAFAFALPPGTFTDADGDPLALTATLADGSALPGWLTFNNATGTFTGTPLNGDVGTISVMVTADDGQGGVVSDVFDITIANTNDAPVVANALFDQAATAGSAMLFTVPANTFADVDVGDSLALTAQAVDAQGNPIAAPAWLAFDAATGTFSGTPGAGDVGTVAIKVTATDDAGATIFDIFDIVVAPAGGGGGNTAPVVANAIANQNATEDAAFAFALPAGTFNDADNDPLTLTATLADGSALPGWLTFNDGTGTFTGTPLNGDVGMISVMVTASDGQGGVVSDVFDITIANVNDAPVVANAIADQIVSAGNDFGFLLPSGTFADADGDPIALSATLADGTALPAWLTFNGDGTFSGTPSAGDIGLVSVKVTANDGHGGTVSDVFDITVVPAPNGGPNNAAPVLENALNDQLVAAGNAFNFGIPDATFSDPDGDALSLSATLFDGSALPAWLTFDAATMTFSGTPQGGDLGMVAVKVVASDGMASTFDTFYINVVEATGGGGGGNNAPVVVNPILDQETATDLAFSFVVPGNTFADPDLDPLTLTASLANGDALPAWLQFIAAENRFVIAAGAGVEGTISVMVTANDGNGGSTFDTFDIVVNPANHAPVVVNGIADQETVEGNPFSLVVLPGTFVDLDGDALELSATMADGSAWPAWLTFDQATGAFSGTPGAGDLGQIVIRVTADDGHGGTSSDDFVITVDPADDGGAPGNTAPFVVEPLADQMVMQGNAFLYHVQPGAFADAEGDALTYTATLANGDPLPIWLSFDAATQTFSGNPQVQDLGTLSVRVTASDGNAVTFDTFDIVVTPAGDGGTPGNTAPQVANPIDDQNAFEGQPFSLVLPPTTFSDPDGDTLVFEARLANGDPLPAWLEFNPATRTFSGTPGANDDGNILVTVTASDGHGGTTFDSFVISVKEPGGGTAPVWVHPVDDLHAMVNKAFTYVIPQDAVTDADVGDSLTFTVAQSNGLPLPNWLSFDPVSKTFSGTPSLGNAGVLTITIKATDSTGNVVTDEFILTVDAKNGAPHGTDATITMIEDMPYHFSASDFGFYDTDGNAMQAVKLTTLPLNGAMTLDGVAVTAGQIVNLADIAHLVWTPPQNGAGLGLGNMTFQVIDNGGTAGGGVNTDASPNSLVFNVVGLADAPVVAVALQDTNAEIGTTFTYIVPAGSFADPDMGDALVLSATMEDGSALPAWLAFDGASGTFTGTPPEGADGTISVKVTAKDGWNLSASDIFVINVTKENLPPDGASKTITINEDATHVFSAADFGYADPEMDAFVSVIITTVPANGAMMFDGVAVTAGQTISINDIGKLGWTPDNNANGKNISSFTFQVQADDGAGEVVADPDANTLTFTVKAANDAPTGTDATIAVTEDVAYHFQAADFGFVDATENDGFASVILTVLPGKGTLTFDGVAVTADQEILVADLDKLVWTTVKDAVGVAYDSFLFKVRDDGGVANGGSDVDAVANVLTIDITDVVDIFNGTRKADTLVGTDGSDILNGKGGKDMLTGSAGVDTFVFSAHYKKDVITDFDATGDDHDILNLTKLDTVKNFNDLVHHHMKQVGDDVIINGLNKDVVVLRDVTKADLDAGDFLF